MKISLKVAKLSFLTFDEIVSQIMELRIMAGSKEEATSVSTRFLSPVCFHMNYLDIMTSLKIILTSSWQCEM